MDRGARMCVAPRQALPPGDVGRGASAGRRPELTGAVRRGGRGLLQLHEDHVGLGVAGVLAGMALRGQPADEARSELDLGYLVAIDEPATKPAQRDHHAVGVRVWRRAVPGSVAVLEDADALVLHHDAI